MLCPCSLIAFGLAYFIREDLRRNKHSEERETTKCGRKKNYEGDDEGNFASDDELLPEIRN